MSNLGKLNYYFLQFMFIRLAKNREPVNHTPFCAQRVLWWSIMFPVIPFTGWHWNTCKGVKCNFCDRYFNIRVTKKKYERIRSNFFNNFSH